MKKWYYINELKREKDCFCQSVARTHDWDEAERWVEILCRTLGKKLYYDFWIADEPRGKEVNWGTWKYGEVFRQDT